MTETVTQERRNEIADGLESMAETLGLAKGHQAILRNASRALRQSDTRVEGGGEPAKEGVGWGDLLAGYQRICAEHGIEPTSTDVLNALKRHDAKEPVEAPRAFCYTATLNLGPRPTIASYFQEGIYTVPLYLAPPLNKSPNPETVGSIYGEFTPISINAPTPEHVEGDVLSVGEMGEDPNKLAAELLEYAERCSDPTNETLRAAAAYISAATTRIQRAEAYREELMKLAAELGEPDDPFAAWEALAALKAQLGGTNG